MKTIDELIFNNHGNYKEYLTLKSKMTKLRLDKLKSQISREKKRLKLIIEKRENQIDKLKLFKTECEQDIEFVSTEYGFRRRINSLLKKHSYLR